MVVVEEKKYDSVSDLLRKKGERKAAAQERKEERENSGEVNKLIIDREPDGLYTCRYSFSGRVPDLLLGKFTRRQQILDIIKLKNIPLEE